MTDSKQEVIERERKETEEPVPFSLTLKTKLTKCDSCQVLDNWESVRGKVAQVFRALQKMFRSNCPAQHQRGLKATAICCQDKLAGKANPCTEQLQDALQGELVKHRGSRPWHHGIWPIKQSAKSLLLQMTIAPLHQFCLCACLSYYPGFFPYRPSLSLYLFLSLSFCFIDRPWQPFLAATNLFWALFLASPMTVTSIVCYLLAPACSTWPATTACFQHFNCRLITYQPVT